MSGLGRKRTLGANGRTGWKPDIRCRCPLKAEIGDPLVVAPKRWHGLTRCSLKPNLPSLGIRITLGASACPPFLPQVHAILSEQGVDMAGISNSRGENVLGFRLAIGVVSALGFASSTLAATMTLTCEGEVSIVGSPTTAPWSGSIDIDYGASTISVPKFNITKAAANINDREISFKLEGRDSFVTIDRLSGVLNVYRIMSYRTETIHARCRPATQKF